MSEPTVEIDPDALTEFPEDDNPEDHIGEEVDD